MRYLVTLESIDDGGMTPPKETAALIENAVIPSLKALAEMEKGGKLKGGVMAGRRGVAMIMDADSNEALSDTLRLLPLWGMAELDIVPLESFEHRIQADGQAAQMMKNM